MRQFNARHSGIGMTWDTEHDCKITSVLYLLLEKNYEQFIQPIVVDWTDTNVFKVTFDGYNTGGEIFFRLSSIWKSSSIRVGYGKVVSLATIYNVGLNIELCILIIRFIYHNVQWIAFDSFIRASSVISSNNNNSNIKKL